MLHIIQRGFTTVAYRAVPSNSPVRICSHLLRCLVGALGRRDGQDVLYLLSILYGEEVLYLLSIWYGEGLQELMLLTRKDGLVIHRHQRLLIH